MTFAISRPFPVLACIGFLAACGDDSSASGSGGGGGSAQTTSASTTGSSTGATTSSGSGSGGDSTGSAGGPGSGGAGPGSGGAGGGTAAFPDDCETAGDCPGGDCVEVAAGFRACRFPVEEATECTSELDECCASEDCDALGGGTCVRFPDASYCGGPQPKEHNVCSNGDTCIDCGKGGGTCLEAGFYGYNQGQCVTQTCFGDADCGAEDGGRCVPVSNPCCRSIVGFFCAYPSDGCRDQADCGADQHCEADFGTGRATCVDGVAKCPA